MNRKIFVLSILPPFLLAGCSGERIISKDRAAELASGIIENKIKSENIDELTILYTRDYSQTASSTESSTSDKNAIIFQLSESKYYLHFKRTNKNHINEQWKFVKDNKLYELARVTSLGQTTAKGYYSKFDYDPNYKIAENNFIFGVMMETLEDFDNQLVDLIDGDHEHVIDEGESKNISYYSRGEGNLHIGEVSELNNSEYSQDKIEGKATGKASEDYYWDNYNPVEMRKSSKYVIEVDTGEQIETYTTTTNTTIFVQYSGTLIDYPELSNFDIHEKLK